MTTSKPPSTLPTSEYHAIEAALLESARGRWFLDEFSRRNRGHDTQVLLEAIQKLETSIAKPGPGANADLIRRDLIEMSEAISRTRQEIAAIKPPDQEDSQLINATSELDAIVEATEKATSDILEAAEEIQEAGWLLRETGEHDEVCDKLDQRATDIYMACSFQDITGQRTDKVVQALRFLEARINSMMEIWQLGEVAPAAKIEQEDSRPDSHLLNGPQLEGKALEQDTIDAMIIDGEDDFEVVDHESDAGQADEKAADEPLSASAIDDIEFDAVTMPETEVENPDAILFDGDLEPEPEPDEDIAAEVQMPDASDLAEAEPEAPADETAELVQSDDEMAGLVETDDASVEADGGELILAEAVEAITQASARIEIRPAEIDDTAGQEDDQPIQSESEPPAQEPAPSLEAAASLDDLLVDETPMSETEDDATAAIEALIEIASETPQPAAQDEPATLSIDIPEIELTADESDEDATATAKALADIETLLAATKEAAEEAAGDHDDLDFGKSNALFS